MKVTKKPKTAASFVVEFDREEDGRWIAEVPKLPGVMAYGATRAEARRKVHAIALRTLASKVEDGANPAQVAQLFYAVAGR